MHPTTDSDKDTQLSVDELHRAAEYAGVNLSKSEVRQLMAMISTDGNDSVSNAEFMKARFLSLHDFFPILVPVMLMGSVCPP
jgi:Ca2+-binding EF-hand superfamily protein